MEGGAVIQRTIIAEIVAAGEIEGETLDGRHERSVLLQFRSDDDFREWLTDCGPISAMWAHERQGVEEGGISVRA